MDSNNAVIPGFDTDKDDSLQIRLDKSFGVPNGLIIYLTGYIDTYNSTYFQKKIVSHLFTYTHNIYTSNPQVIHNF